MRFDLEVGAPAAGGACVGRAPDGRVVFVRHALPGERVTVEVTSQTSNFLRADAVEVLQASPDRVAAPCPYAHPGGCGGCDWQHAALPAQRAMKAQLISEHLLRIAGLERRVPVEQAPGAPDGLGWRSRIQFAVSEDGRPGLRRHRSHELEHVDRCLIAAPGVQAVGAERRRWHASAAVQVASTDDGSQRVVGISRRGRARPIVPEVDAGIALDGVGIRTPHGLCHLVGGRRFQVATGGFWQVHVGAAELLVEAVLQALQPRPGDRVLDLYAGAGLFAAHLGEAVGAPGSVLAVESVPRACADAARNTADLPQVRIRTATVDAALVARSAPIDLVVLDPPRAGAGQQVAAALAGCGARRVAYVSCAAASFARDARVLLDAGWSLVSLRAFDLYPMTEHVELLGLFEPAAVLSDSAR